MTISIDAHSEGSRIPCHKDVPAALWGEPPGELRPPTNSPLREQGPWQAAPQPQSGFEMTAAVASV